MSRSPSPREPESAPGVNGSGAPDAPPPPRPGGRLKFYQDGKVVLELATARSGDRTAWVSVPRKSHWTPPAGPPTATAAPPRPTQRRERAASLSVSDDNSSVQSSPWQRDHRWKQSAPRRGVSRELAGCYLRPAGLSAALLTAPAARRKRRRPFDVAPVETTNGTATRLTNGASRHRDESCGRMRKKSRRRRARRDLADVVRALADRPSVRPAAVNAKTAVVDCKRDRAMVSPRKRILMEFEREEQEDSTKRSRSRGTVSTPKPGPSRAHSDGASSKTSSPASSPFDATPPSRSPVVSKPVSSYSIHSLLSKPDGRGSAPTYDSPDLGSSPESSERRPRAAGPEPVISRPPDKYYYRDVYRGPEDPAAAYPWYQPAPYAPSPAYYGAGYHQPYGPRAHHPFLLPYPVLPPGPWSALAGPLLADRAPREDSSSDLPLNLSKH